MAKFKVINVFTLSNRMLVFLQGEILDGEVRIGDRLQLPWNSCAMLVGEISSIEFSDSADGSYVCLGLNCKSAEEREIWLGMNIEDGEVFEILKNG